MLTNQFKNKVAFITGAANGIGRASALEFARYGAKVVLADIEAKGLEDTLAEVKKLGGEGIAEVMDVTQAEQIRRVIDKAVQTYGRLDCAHNNAGIEGRRVKTAEYTEEEWDRIIQVNLKGVWLCMKYEIEKMLETGGGAIVNTSSIAGLVGLRKSAVYSVSKHGIVGLTKTAALEYAKSGIRINAVCPGMIETDMVDRAVLGEEPGSGIDQLIHKAKKSLVHSKLKKDQPGGRMGSPEEVAHVVAWLCSNDASFITGHLMPVDGGYTAR